MPGRIEKTVFISYRRTNLPWALAIYQNLTTRGYDVFFDFQSINSGDFEQVILGNIRARAHFLVVLTPAALERCSEPSDWLRREIETALDEKRNIVPLFFEGFNFGSPSIVQYLTGKLSGLRAYNGLNVPADYFDEALMRLRDRYLNVALDAVIHPVSPTVQKKVEQQQIAASKAKDVDQNKLSAQEWAEKAYAQIDETKYQDAFYSANKAVELDPQYSFAYAKRGLASYYLNNKLQAIIDYTDAIRLNPDDEASYNNRGLARYDQGDLAGATRDYNEAIRLKPDYADAFYNRGIIHSDKGDLESAIKDYNEAIRLKPDYVDAFNNRGVAYFNKTDFINAIRDFEKAIQLNPRYTLAKDNLKLARSRKK